MRIVQVIHGYPMRYNAGSEVYTQGLAQALAERHDVHVFTRQENAFLPEYAVQRDVDPSEPGVALRVVNMARARDGYRHQVIDDAFAAVSGRGAARRRAYRASQPPVNVAGVRGQQARRSGGIHAARLLADVSERAVHPDVSRKFRRHRGPSATVRTTASAPCVATPATSPAAAGSTNRMPSTGRIGWAAAWPTSREVCGAVDVFIAPAMYLLRRFRDEFGLPAEKLVYLDYGFHLERMAGRKRPVSEALGGEPFIFGYIGTHIPAKGVDHLIRAFGGLSGDSRLRVWGRDRGVETAGLKTLARNLPGAAGERVEWMGEYRNQDIVPDVFNRCDAIVVPSIWAENSPLVIHEAQQARVPVITAGYGGMAEYVRHEENGLLFAHRDTESLARQMQRLADDPGAGAAAGQPGLPAIAGRQRAGHAGPCPGGGRDIREIDTRK